MGRMNFKTAKLDAWQRLQVGVIGLVGLMASMVVGIFIANLVFLYEFQDLVAFAAIVWGAAWVYVSAWNRWSPWAPKEDNSELREQ